MSLINRVVLNICKKGKRIYDPLKPLDYPKVRKEEIEKIKKIKISKQISFENEKLGNVSFQHITYEDNPNDKVYFYIHGGGFVVGSPDSRRMFTGYLAKETNYNVYAIDYPLAPENPYPEGINNCLEGYLELLKKYHSNNIILIGESAGGNLVLSLLLKIKELNLSFPYMAFVLSPCVQFDKELKSYKENDKTEGMVANLNEEVLDIYLNGNKELLKDPMVAPLYGDFSGSCPIYLFVSSSEKLYDDSVLLFAKLKEQEIKSELFVRKGMVHTWIVIPQIPEAKRDITKIKKIIDNEL